MSSSKSALSHGLRSETLRKSPRPLYVPDGYRDLAEDHLYHAKLTLTFPVYFRTIQIMYFWKRIAVLAGKGRMPFVFVPPQ